MPLQTCSRSPYEYRTISAFEFLLYSTKFVACVFEAGSFMIDTSEIFAAGGLVGQLWTSFVCFHGALKGTQAQA